MMLRIYAGNKIVFSGQVTSDAAKEIITKANSVQTVHHSIKNYIKIICDYYHITEEQMKIRSRRLKYAKARWMLMYHMIVRDKATERFVGSVLNLDHSTVNYGVKMVKQSFLHEYKKIFPDQC